jgi:NADPH-dependent 2,4-dienoyl-CoA reductase/sulfur reductase-like enzyme
VNFPLVTFNPAATLYNNNNCIENMVKAVRSLDVLIVGAGLGGLAAGLALQTDGHRVTIVDAAPEFGEVSNLSSRKNDILLRVTR